MHRARIGMCARAFLLGSAAFHNGSLYVTVLLRFLANDLYFVGFNYHRILGKPFIALIYKEKIIRLRCKNVISWVHWVCNNMLRMFLFLSFSSAFNKTKSIILTNVTKLSRTIKFYTFPMIKKQDYPFYNKHFWSKHDATTIKIQLKNTKFLSQRIT